MISTVGYCTIYLLDVLNLGTCIVHPKSRTFLIINSDSLAGPLYSLDYRVIVGLLFNYIRRGCTYECNTI